MKIINRCTVKYGRFCSDLQEISDIQQMSFGDLSALTVSNIKIPNIIYNNCSVSRWRPHEVDKRMVLVHTHGLFIT